MKTTDLMLNDLVLYRGEVAKVIAITANGEVSLLVDGHIVARFVYAEELSPIPLTPEILEKNGFIYKKLKGVGDKEIWRIEDEHYDIDIYEWSDSIWIFRYDYVEMSSPHTQVTMGFVHELQHALKICGIEKEITL